MPKGYYKRTKEYRELMKRVMTPIMRSPEIREKIKNSMIGKKPLSRKPRTYGKSMKGIPWSEARREAQKFVKRKRVRRRYKRRGREYCLDWHLVREVIYKRDNWTCQECFRKCHNGIKIQCHHIDFNVDNNKKDNLITLCASCHIKTLFKKENWIRYYREKMSHCKSMGESRRLERALKKEK